MKNLRWTSLMNQEQFPRRRVEDIFARKLEILLFSSLPLLLIVATEFKGGGQGEFGKVKRHAWCRLAIR